MSDPGSLKKLVNGAAVVRLPIGTIISRVRDKGKDFPEIETVYSVSSTGGLVKADEFRDHTIHSEDTSNYTVVRQGMFAYNPARLNIGSIAYLKADDPGLVSPMYVAFAVNEEVASKQYLSYFLKSRSCRNKIESLTEEGARFRFDFERWHLIEIPVPSLEVQAEIVRILDAFTELSAELSAELTARKKQYDHYRDQLLSFKGGDVAWKALGALAEVNTGAKPAEILESATPFDYINAGTTRSGYSATSNCEGDTVTTPSRGQGGIGFVGYQSKPFWLGPLCYKLRSTDQAVLINKYLFYFLQSRTELILELKKEGGVPAVNKSDLVQMQIPVPSVEEQRRVVALLDKFDALTNSVTEGLPREIELRQKQYEYYRDWLLSFPKPVAVEA